MSDDAAVHLLPVAQCEREALLRLAVHPSQRDYVGTIADLLADAAHCGDGDALAIVHGDRPVGYCRLDAHARSVAGRDFDEPARGLRGFFIDTGWQGRGLGLRALRALYAHLAAHDPHTRLLVLTVNCRNHAALALYRRAGFTESGELYHGGRAGPQHLMLRHLDNPL
jgi:RimJ/RimL family protein N-acetyltransferase